MQVSAVRARDDIGAAHRSENPREPLEAEAGRLAVKLEILPPLVIGPDANRSVSVAGVKILFPQRRRL